MAITQTGSTLQFNIGTAVDSGTVSSTITVPSDATLAIATCHSYGGTAYVADCVVRLTQGASQVAMAAQSNAGSTTSAMQVGMWVMALPDTGTNKTLDYDFPGATTPNEPPVFTLTFWKGVDTSSPVRSTSGGFSGTTPPYTTGSLTAGSGDLIVAATSTFNSSTEGSATTWSGLSTLTNLTLHIEVDGALATGSPSGSGAVALSSATNFGDGSIVAVVLKPAVAGATMPADVGTIALTGQAAVLRVAPWEIVGVGTSVEVTATTHTLTVPAGVAQGDLLVAVISSRIASTTSITLPSGGEWTLVTEQKTNNILSTGSAVASGMMAYCVRGASNPNLTFTHPTAPSVALGRIVAYRGVNTSSPKDTQGSTTTAISTTSVSVTGITTAGVNELIVVGLCGGQEAAWSVVDATSPSVASGATDTTTRPKADTWLERADVQTTTGVDTSLAIADGVKAAAGATGNITATASVAASHAILIGAFKPVPVSMAPYTLTADQASFAVNGQTAILRYGHVLTAAQASFQINGQAAGLKRGLKVTATFGTFALTGQTAALRAIRTMPAAQGAFALTGQTATLRRGKVLIATTAGSFALTGQTATLKRNYVMPAAQAAFALNGSVVNLAYSGAGSKTMSANTGTFALSGQTATLLATRKLPATQAAFALNGQTVTLRRTRLPLVAAQGSFLLNGQTAATRIARKLPATFGTFALTGQSVVLRVTLPAAQASFAINGQTVTLRYGHKLTATFGTFALNGQTATLKRTYVMPAAKGQFNINGQTVILDYSGEGDVGMPASAGFFALNGQTATLRTIRKLTATFGTFALTGQATALHRNRNMPVAPGMFNAAAQPANLFVTGAADRVLVATQASFVLTGNVVALDVARVTALEAQPGRLTFGRKVSVRRW